MNKTIPVIIVICFLLLFSSCAEKQASVENESNAAQDLPKISSVACQSIPTGFHYDNYAIIDQTLFLHGTGNNGASFFCVDLVADKKTDIELPISGPVMDLSVSKDGACLATVYSSRSDETSTARGCFTLFEIQPDASVKSQVELTGIDDINLLAIGTPVVNGSAIINDNILIIVNNRVILLDKEGNLINYIIWESGHPRIACANNQMVCVYDVVDNEMVASILRVSTKNTMDIAVLDCPKSSTDIIPSHSDKEIFIVENDTVYAFDISTNQQRPVWSFPYGFSNEKGYYYNNISTFLECYRGRIVLYSIQ